MRRFEQMLIDEGALILKFWMHLSKEAQRKRLKKLESDPLTRWRVTERDWKHFELYDTFQEISERALRRTSTAAAPWIQVEATDPRYQKLTVGTHPAGAAARRAWTTRDPAPASVQAPPARPSFDGLNILGSLDLTQKLDKATYERELEKYQGRLNLLTRHKAFQDHNVIAGVRGHGRRRQGRRHPPHHPGHRRPPVPHHPHRRALRGGAGAALPLAVLAQPAAPGPVRHLRPQLVRPGAGGAGGGLLRRGGLDARLRRDQRLRGADRATAAASSSSSGSASARRSSCGASRSARTSPFKRFKITADDWRNREKWDAYETAICDMLDRTSTEIAPWTLVESEDKNFGRIKILRTLCERIEEKL